MEAQVVWECECKSWALNLLDAVKTVSKISSLTKFKGKEYQNADPSFICTFLSITIVWGYSHRMRSMSKMGCLCLCIIAQRRGIATQFLHFKSFFCLTSKLLLEPHCENQDVITLCAEQGAGEQPDSGLNIFPFPEKIYVANSDSNISCNSL